ncbi:MAG: hypothetical protein V1743_04465, partial [Nanoarchaeota archaeon]
MAKKQKRRLTQKGKIQELRMISLTYRFFHTIHETIGMDGVVAFIRDLTPERVPDRAELSNPQAYMRKYLQKIYSEGNAIGSAYVSAGTVQV